MITDTIAAIDEVMLQWTRKEIEYHLDKNCKTNGVYIGVYWIIKRKRTSVSTLHFAVIST